jgi:hypothetical protein
VVVFVGVGVGVNAGIGITIFAHPDEQASSKIIDVALSGTTTISVPEAIVLNGIFTASEYGDVVP